MWITFVIVASFVVAMIAMAYFGIQSHDEAVQRREAHGADPGACGLCNAPLKRAATTDEVIFELEHRIDAELGEIARAWQHSHPDTLRRTFPV